VPPGVQSGVGGLGDELPGNPGGGIDQRAGIRPLHTTFITRED